MSDGDFPDRALRRQIVANQPFGAWLLRQRDRGDHIGILARAAAKDRRFPSRGSSREVCARVLSQVWDEDTVTALEDALTEWRTLVHRAVRAGLRSPRASTPYPPRPAPDPSAAALRP